MDSLVEKCGSNRKISELGGKGEEKRLRGDGRLTLGMEKDPLRRRTGGETRPKKELKRGSGGGDKKLVCGGWPAQTEERRLDQ